MTTTDRNPITVETIINAPVEKVWERWTDPIHITRWNAASDDWHTPHATNDLRAGGSFTSRMEAKDGSMGFDFGGIYDEVDIHKLISYTMSDGRKVRVEFIPDGNQVKVVETFDAETTHSRDMQKAGWQAILDNFKNYSEQPN